jgi:HK97 gp10 family phage protein
MRRKVISLRQLEELYGPKAKSAASKELRKIAGEIAEDARKRCPKRTGKLAASIHVEQKGTKLRIVADAKAKDGTYYGRLVEFSPKIAHPFLYPAYDAHKDSIKERIARSIREALR